MKKFTLLVLLAFAALTAPAAQTQTALTPEAFLGGHSYFVSSAVFSPDGRRIATASGDKTVKLWNAETGQLIRTFTGHTGTVFSVAFNPNGMRLASGSLDETVKLWNAETGQEIRTITGHSGNIISITFSPDGTRLASGSLDKTVKLWNAETGQVIRTMTGHSSNVHFVAFSSGGARIISVSYGAIKVFDANTGREISNIDLEDPVDTAVCSPDGRSVITSVGSQGELKIWDLETGRETRTIPMAGKGEGFAAAYSPDGRYIVTDHSDSNITIWHVETGREQRTLTGHSDGTIAFAFSPDGRRILSGSGDATAKIWDAETGREIRSLPAIPAPLTRELLADDLNAAGANAKTSGPFSGASLYKPAPKETALQFGAMVQKELAVLRFLEPNNAAVGRYEAILQSLTARGNVTRAEVESYYRQGIGALIAGEVDREFNRVSFVLDNTASRTSYDAVLTRGANNQYILNYKRLGTKYEPITANSLDELLSAMSRNSNFDHNCINAVRSQAALIPAVRLTSQALGDIKTIITSFYTNPNAGTYSAVKDVYVLYNNTAVVSVSVFFRMARDSYGKTLASLNTALAERVINAPTRITDISRTQVDRLTSLLE
jgi:Tol biopolymer transport system component